MNVIVTSYNVRTQAPSFVIIKMAFPLDSMDAVDFSEWFLLFYRNSG